MYFPIMLSSVCELNFEVKTRTATKFLSLLLSCVALGSDTQGTHKEQNLFFVRHAREWKLESDVQKNRSIKPKIRWKAKKSPDVWQGQHQALKVQQALILPYYGFYGSASAEPFLFNRSFPADWGARLRISGGWDSFISLLTKTAKETIIPVRQTMEPGVCSP